ncbi:hypothetical protein [Lysobacter gummosus]
MIAIPSSAPKLVPSDSPDAEPGRTTVSTLSTVAPDRAAHSLILSSRS